MVSVYLIQGFNNYYNRKLKRGETPSEYYNVAAHPDPLEDDGPLALPYYFETDKNFNPNDGITTTAVFNQTTVEDPDYMLVCDNVNFQEIISRWYVLEFRQLRNGQFMATLRRDVLADYKDNILDAPMFIEKAKLPNSDPRIFNSEEMTFNQIKVSETLLKNSLDTPWLVAYLSRKDNANNYQRFNQTFKVTTYYDEEYTDMADYEANCPYAYLMTAHEVTIPTEVFFGVILKKHSSGTTVYKRIGLDNSAYKTIGRYYNMPEPNNPSYFMTISNPDPPVLGTDEQRVVDYAEINAIYQALHAVNPYVNDITGWINEAGVDVANQYNGKIIKIGNDLYTCKVNNPYHGYDWEDYAQASGTALSLKIKSIVSSRFGVVVFNDEPFYISIHANTKRAYTFELNQVITGESLSYDMQLDKEICKGAPYEIFATPLKDITFTDGGNTYNHKGSLAQEWINNLAQCYSGTALYDAQIVPYCPIDRTNLSGLTYKTLSNGVLVRAVGVYLDNSSFSLTINHNIALDPDWKIGNETELYRIVSPNGVGIFEFSPYKNGGVTGFEVDCTLLPISPYIKVNPIFGGLYGGDFDDYRGLICAGDFSIAITSNAWQQYQINNKYYQQIFDRQIEHMEVENRMQFTKEIIGGVTATGAAAIAGASKGGAAGAIGAGLSTAALSAANIVMGETLRQENLDYTKDQFGYNLQTIQARPQSLTRSTSYNINNKYFPYLEKYDCTEIEKQALRDKIKYNGMTVMCIGKINEYLWSEPTYIKAKLIKITWAAVDYHVMTEIAAELDKGIFM